MRKTYILTLLTLLYFLIPCSQGRCAHDQLRASKKKMYIDLQENTSRRNLIEQSRQPIRIFYDFGYLQGISDQNKVVAIQRMMNISRNYFSMTLKVDPLTSLSFPNDGDSFCDIFRVPTKYMFEKISADLGVIVGGQNNPQSNAVASAIDCRSLASTKRPVWGLILFNEDGVNTDQYGFQQTLYVAVYLLLSQVHQLTHILGFSAELYQDYPAGNPLVQNSNGYFLTSPQIQKQIKDHFKCENAIGLPLQDQDGTLISSHWQKKVMGQQYMIAQNHKGPFISRFTLALLDSTGWYDVNYTMAQPTHWGKQAGCNFLDIDNCQGGEFCNKFKVAPDWDHTAYGICRSDSYSGSCQRYNYYTNTICTDPQSYNTTNVNRATYSQTFQIANYQSRAYESDIYNITQKKPQLSLRCYETICGFSNRYVFVKFTVYNGTYNDQQDQKLIQKGQTIINEVFYKFCTRPDQTIKFFKPYLSGQLKCPSDFKRVCDTSKTCPYHCNKNGMCINGQCLCNGNNFFNFTCLDTASAVVGTVPTASRRFNSKNYLVIPTKSIQDQIPLQYISQGVSFSSKLEQLLVATRQSINTQCISNSLYSSTKDNCKDCHGPNCQQLTLEDLDL